MHPNFYHWHNRAELKPETAILQARWDAAAKFSGDLCADDICSLLRLALFGTAEPEFANRFSKALVVMEPTFLPEGNAELLRVMATAALYVQIDEASFEGDAVALGFVAAAFQPDRIKPVCKELGEFAVSYLAKEADRLRPTPNVGKNYNALKKAIEVDDWAAKPEATQWIGKAVLELGDTMVRVAEENQFMWWLLSRYSSIFDARRENLSPKEYALAAAVEAANRVALLPPSPSVESLIREVLTHCSKSSNSAIPLTDFVEAAKPDVLGASKAGTHQLCPVNDLLEIRRAGGQPGDTSLKGLTLPAKLKVPSSEIAIQYFRELMFLKALNQLS